MAEIHGHAQPRFAGVRELFARSFETGEELGARFSAVLDGETVIDLWGGHADRAETKAFDDRTLTTLFSSTKALAALMVARLVDQGRLSYDQRVAEVWPEFGQMGKEALTVGQVLSHQGGLSGFPDEMDPAEYFDWTAICAKLAAMAPLWPPGTASGYHPITFGYLAGEIFRRVDGRTLGTALREDLCAPLDLDIWIGLPDAEFERVAQMDKPRSLPRFGALNAATKAAFLTPWSQPASKNPTAWRKMEIPSANGHATAIALARLFGALAGDGWLDGVQVLSPQVRDEAARSRIRGQDLVLPFEMSWGAGFMRNETVHPWGPGNATFGHSGWGGSCVFADPETKLACGYVMNRQTAELLGDQRPKRLIEAVYSAL